MSIVSSACSLAGPICSVVKDAAGTAAGAVGGGILDSIASEFSSAEGEMLKLLLSAWVNVPTPNLSSTSGTVGFLQSSLSWYVAAAAVLGLLVAAGRLAIERKPDAAKDAATGMLTTLLTIGAGVATISLLSAAGDAFSTWILDQAAGSATPTQALTQLGSFAGLMATGGAGLIILLSVLAIIGMVVQLAMVLIRSVLLVVLVGVWPLAAASSMTEMGRQWYKKITGWMIAFLLFKPAAAIVYAAAIKMTLSSDSVLASIEGIILIILASLTLPALMKFIVPAVSSVGSMGAGEVLGAGIAAATGAAMVIGTAGIGAAAAGGGRAGRVGRRWSCQRWHGWRNLRRRWAARGWLGWNWLGWWWCSARRGRIRAGVTTFSTRFIGIGVPAQCRPGPAGRGHARWRWRQSGHRGRSFGRGVNVMTTAGANAEPRTYGNWRRPTSPGIGSLGLFATMILLGGTVVAVISSMIFWPLALLVVFFTIITLVHMAIHDRHGRNGFQVLLPRLAAAHAARDRNRSVSLRTAQPCAPGALSPARDRR